MESKDPRIKHKRNTNIIKTKHNYPGMSCAKIARVFKISRQRVHVILYHDYPERGANEQATN